MLNTTTPQAHKLRRKAPYRKVTLDLVHTTTQAHILRRKAPYRRLPE